jgi:cell cycle protein kinase DBF2
VIHASLQVGQGGYGSVYLARKVDTGEVCALKKMKKTTLAKMDEVRYDPQISKPILRRLIASLSSRFVVQIKHVLVERDILTATKTPWLVSLLYAFQDPEHIYLAMVRALFPPCSRGGFRTDVIRLALQEYVPGGDFRTLLNNSGVLKEEHARFYISEMFVAVDQLHKLGYIRSSPSFSLLRSRTLTGLLPNRLTAFLTYSHSDRDLKPENFLVDGTGHVKLTDFGLATGALNPVKIESMKNKVRFAHLFFTARMIPRY